MAQWFDGIRAGDRLVDVKVSLNSNGALDVIYDGVRVFDEAAIGYTLVAGRFGFGAGTEESAASARDIVGSTILGLKRPRWRKHSSAV